MKTSDEPVPHFSHNVLAPIIKTTAMMTGSKTQYKNLSLKRA
ncbi:hypothetical protein PPEP_a1967 [Pseudoalteromonas peptidolytica F12-50-A1]|uniref:Uncharacterized protein n=1 Tax=Pseudoalteromonas peptidolytica F12-50-A1 TaxID=1315280 RepID=A0A8I0MXV4_9GAMM|nr:hypothetical protein [Pseudoalteromonas peptidolytica F12-50-A1]